MQSTIDDYTRRVKLRYTWPKLSMRQKLLTGVQALLCNSPERILNDQPFLKSCEPAVRSSCETPAGDSYNTVGLDASQISTQRPAPSPTYQTKNDIQPPVERKRVVEIPRLKSVYKSSVELVWIEYISINLKTTIWPSRCRVLKNYRYLRSKYQHTT